MVPQEAARHPARQSRAATGRHVWRRLSADPAIAGGGVAPFAAICKAEIARLHVRLDAVNAGAAEASALSAGLAARGDASSALRWEVQAKFLALEKGLLTRALGHWQQVKAGGHFACPL